MAAGDREATFILKAADLSSQPLTQIIAVLEKLTAAQNKLNEASKAGLANTNDSKQAIQGLESVFGALEKRILTLVEYNRALDEAANRAGRVADLEDKREKLVRSQNIPEDKKDQTKEQRAQLRDIDKDLNSANRSYDSAKKTLDTMRETLARMGESARTVAGSIAQATTAMQANIELLTRSRQVLLDQPGDRLRAKEEADQQAAAERQVATAAERARLIRAAAHDEDIARQKQVADARRKAAEDEAEFAQKSRRSNATFAFTPLLDQHDREMAAQKDAAVKLKEINDAALAAARNTARQAEQLAKQREDAEIASANAIINVTRALEKAKTDAATADRKLYEDGQRQRAADLTAQQDFARFEAQLQARAEEAYQQRQEQAAALSKQRNLVAQAQASLPERQPLGVSAEPVQGFSSTAQQIEGIIAPAAQARATLSGLEAEIVELGEAVQKTGLRTEAYLKLQRQTGLVFAELKRQGNLVDRYSAQEEVTRRAEEEQRKQVATLDALAVRAKNATVAEEGFARELKVVEAAARQATVTLNAENETLAKLRAGLDAAGISYLNLGAATVRLNTAAVEARKAFEGIDEKARKAGESIALGLNPYHLQIVADHFDAILTQVSSGISVSQIAAQHSGQLLQDFQLQLLGLAKSIAAVPFGIALATSSIALLTVGVLAFVRAMDEASARRSFGAQLAASVDGARYSVEGLIEAAKGAEHLGASFDEAVKGAQELSKAGFDQGRVTSMLLLATKLSQAFGKPLAEAVKEVSAAFSGGYEGMHKFANEYDLLTLAEDRGIKTLYAQNQAVEAGARAFDLINGRMTEARNAGLGPLNKAFIDLKENYHALLDSINSGGLVAAVTHDLSLFLGDIRAIIEGVKWLDEFATKPRFGQARPSAPEPGVPPGTVAATDSITREQLQAQITSLEQRLERQKAVAGETAKATGHGGFAEQELQPTTVKQAGYGGEGFSQQRDSVADLLGLNREALKRLQESEGVWIADQHRWQNAHDNDPSSHATGPMQLQPDTFKGLKAQHPDLITGDINDVRSNLIAGAIELKNQVIAAGGSFYRAVEGYHMGGVNVPPNRDAVKQADKAATGFAAPVIEPRTIAATEAALATLRAQMEKFGGTTEKNKITTADFVEQLDKETLAVRNTGKDAQTAAEQQDKALDELRKGLIERGQKSGADRDKVAEEAAIERRVQAERDKFAEERLAKEAGVTSKMAALREKELGGDKTNTPDRLTAVNLQFDEIQRGLEAERRKGAGNVDDKFAEVEQLRQRALERTALESSQAIVDAAKKQQDDAYKQISDLVNQGSLKGEALTRRLADTFAKFGPIIRKAVQDSNAAIGDADTPQAQAQRERNQALLVEANRPRQIGQITQQATGQATKAVADEQAIRDKQLEALASEVRGGTTNFHDALQAGLAIIKETGPAYRKAIADENANLEAIRAAPTSTALERSTARADIAANNARLAKSDSEALEKVITEALKDDQERLARILKERDEAIKKINERALRGLDSPVQTAAALAKAKSEYDPRVQAAAQAVFRDTTEAQAQPGLSAGFRARLSEQQTSAQNAGDTKLFDAEEVKTQVAAGLASLGELRSYLKDTEHEQAQLQKLGQATTESTEAARRAAYAKTNAEAGKIIPTLRKVIDEAEKLGTITPAAAAKARASIADFNTETKYATKFQEDLIKTIETSFESRGVQAFDTIAQSLGNLIAHTGTWKDVLTSVRDAFANFTAGILQDVAKMIIKMYLLKAVQTLVGMAGGGVQSAGETALVSGASSSLASVGSSVAHSGGVIGESALPSRVVDLSLFRQARRMHSGGTVAGLSADEVPAILQKGEQVLSKSQVRNMQAAGGSNSGGGQVRNVLAVGDKEIAQAMNSSHGERVVLNVLKRNAPSVRQMLG